MFCVIKDSGLVNLFKNKNKPSLKIVTSGCVLSPAEMRRVKLKTSINSWAASPLTAIDLLYLHYAELKERDVTFVSQFEVIAHFYW